MLTRIFIKSPTAEQTMASWLLLGLLAFTSFGISCSVDKYILKERYYPLIVDAANVLVNSLFLIIAGLLFFDITIPWGWKLLPIIGLGLLFAASITFYFFSLKEGDATYILPFEHSVNIIFIFFFSLFIFDEVAVWYNVLGILLLVVGVFLIISDGRFGLPKFSNAIKFSLLSAGFYVAFQLLAKHLLVDVSPITLAFIFYFTAAIAVSIFLLARPSLWRKAERTFELKGLSHVAVSSLFGASGAFLLLIAVSLGDASKVYPLSAFQEVIILLIAWLFFHEKLHWWRLLGIAVIIFGIILVSL